MHLRQIALVARHLEPVVADLCAVLGLEIGFRDPGVGEFGLHNAVMPVGTQFLEVVSPTREGTTAGRFLARRQGDGGYMTILQTDDIAADRRRVAGLGVRIVWQATLDDIATIHLHPADVGGAIVSLDQPEPRESWRWAGPDWKSKVRRDGARAITSATIEADDPVRMAARWAEVLGLPSPRRAGNTVVLELAPGAIHFMPAGPRGEGLAAVGVAAPDRDRMRASARARGLEDPGGGAVRIGGVLFELES